MRRLEQEFVRRTLQRATVAARHRVKRLNSKRPYQLSRYGRCTCILEAPVEIEPTVRDLQSPALPLGYGADVLNLHATPGPGVATTCPAVHVAWVAPRTPLGHLSPMRISRLPLFPLGMVRCCCQGFQGLHAYSLRSLRASC